MILPSHFGALLGGAEYQAKLLIDHLAATDAYEIYYLARFTNPESLTNGHTVITIGGLPSLRRFGYFFDALNLLAALKRVRPDVIYQRVGCAYTGVCALYARQTGCPMIWHIASDIEVTPQPELKRVVMMHKALEKWLLEYGIRNATCIVAQTMQQAAMLETHYGRQALKVIPNFQPTPREACATKSDTVQIVWIANFKRLKRPEVFLQLARDFADRKDVEFIMVGDISADRMWQESVDQELAQLSNVRRLGRVRQDEVNELLARSHVLVNTSDYEGFSNTFIQAWLRNVVVVSYRVNPDGVFDQDRLGICAGGSYESLRCSVLRLVEDSALRSAFVGRALPEARENHSMRNIESIRITIDALVKQSANSRLLGYEERGTSEPDR